MKGDVLVFGRTGQVAQALAAKAPRTWVFAGREQADLTDEAALKKLIDSKNWNAVVNAAAYTAVDRAESEQELAHAVNANAPGAMARACAENNIPFVHISTDYVFDGNGDRPYTENDPINPLSIYGKTKADGEKAVMDAGGRAVILRTSWVYAPEGKNFVNTMLKLGQEREELRIVSDQKGAPTSAADIADGIMSILSRFDAGGIFHMTAGGSTTWHGFATEIFRIAREKGLKTPGRVIPITTAEYPTPAKRPLNSRLDCSKLEKVYGVALPSWQEGLAVCMDSLFPSTINKKEVVS
ncbi:MAG TPA: dTDP-4-dehydrorhamnose reductase [Rhodospirillaceae bacterium]|nr:dTDP-4-dehydrorhamnose reductase [Rhodospirillaceae bacterium]